MQQRAQSCKCLIGEGTGRIEQNPMEHPADATGVKFEPSEAIEIVISKRTLLIKLHNMYGDMPKDGRLVTIVSSHTLAKHSLKKKKKCKAETALHIRHVVHFVTLERLKYCCNL